jgi:hypothetical protein
LAAKRGIDSRVRLREAGGDASSVLALFVAAGALATIGTSIVQQRSSARNARRRDVAATCRALNVVCGSVFVADAFPAAYHAKRVVAFRLRAGATVAGARNVCDSARR